MFEYFNAAQADIHYAVISVSSLAKPVLIPNLPTIYVWSAQTSLLPGRILLYLQWINCRMFTNKKGGGGNKKYCIRVTSPVVS